MKKTLRIISLIAIITFINSCVAQKTSESNLILELPEEFFQRWKLDYGMANGQKISGLPQSPSNDYEFKKNRKYLIYNGDGTFITGSWEYNSEEKTVYTKRKDGELNGKIVNIKKKSITLIPAGKAVEGTPFENFRFYHIPKTD